MFGKSLQCKHLVTKTEAGRNIVWRLCMEGESAPKLLLHTRESDGNGCHNTVQPSCSFFYAHSYDRTEAGRKKILWPFSFHSRDIPPPPPPAKQILWGYHSYFQNPNFKQLSIKFTWCYCQTFILLYYIAKCFTKKKNFCRNCSQLSRVNNMLALYLRRWTPVDADSRARHDDAPSPNGCTGDDGSASGLLWHVREELRL